MKTRNLLSGILLAAVSLCFVLSSQTALAQPCLGDTPWGSITLDGTNEIAQISTGNLMQDYGEVLGATAGDQYTFISTDNSGTDPIYITVRSGTFNGPVLGSGFSPLTITSDVSGAIYPHFSNNALCDYTSIGTFTSTVQCITCPVYCEDLDMLEGDPCDDGDPATNYDMITADCECAGNLPCIAGTDWQGATLDGTNTIMQISSGNLINDYSEVLGATTGDQYTFVSTDNSGTDPIYITVRSGTYDGPVIGSGYSPLTVTSDVDGAIYPHYSNNEFCEYSSIGSFTSTVQCISCPVYCEDLDMVEGDPCDDGDPATNYDMITADCECAGNLPCIAGTDWQGATLDGTNTIMQISSGNLINDYSEVLGATTGDQYTFVSTDNSGTDPIYITVRSGTYDGPVIGSGYSPLTVTSDIDGAIYPHYSNNEFCEYSSIGSFTSTVQCISCPVYCEDLDMLEGDPCDDGDPATNYDMITSDCECAGNLPCLASTYWGSGTLDGTNVIIQLSASNLMNDFNEALNATSGDQYTFTSTDNNGTDPIYITVRSGTYDGPVIGSGYSPLTVTSDVDGSLFAHYSNNEFCDFIAIGSFTSTVQCITCPVYCEELDMVEGDPCDDGDPATNYDMITSDCECAGNLPCLAGTLWGSATLDGTNVITQISSSNLMNDYSQVLNATTGDQYTFASTPNSGTDPIYITVRSGTSDGPVIGSGYSPLTITSDIEGTLFAHYSNNEFCDFTPIGSFTSTVQCITCPVYCEELDMVEGDPCDDGNPDTNFDVITEDCECLGTEACLNTTAYSNITLNGTSNVQTINSCMYTTEYNTINNAFEGDEYTFTALKNGNPAFITIRSGSFDGPVLGFGFSPLTVTSNIDGALFMHVTLNELCEDETGCVATTVQCITCDYNCPSIGADIGDACDDGNPDTTGEVINEFCECAVPGLATLSGTVNWNGACGDRELVIGLFETGTDNLVEVVIGVLNSDGTYSHAGFPTGTFDVYAVLEGHLSKGYPNQTLNAGSNTLDLGSFIDGDINGTNGINISDFSLLNVSFGSSEGDSNYNYLADMNCDGNVNIIDVSILNIGFGMVGETPD